MKTRVPALALLLSSLAAFPAFAQGAIPAFELESLQLSPAATGSLLLSTGRILNAGELRVSMIGNYAHAPFRLGEGNELISDRITGHVAAAVGIRSGLELFAQVPYVAYQRDNSSFQGFSNEPVTQGLGTPWLGARAGLLNQDDGAFGNLNFALSVGLPLGARTALGKEDGWAVLPQLSLSHRYSAVEVGLEASALLRHWTALEANGQSGYAQSQVALGASVTGNSTGTRGEFNARLAMGLKDQKLGGEALVGVRTPLGGLASEFFALAGPGFGGLVGTPTVRLVVGVAVGKEPFAKSDKDTDGIPDERDACPTEPGPGTVDGCPVKDADNDGVVDAQDACPTEAGPAERQGCPVKDTDKDGVEDAQDACPSEAGTIERKGCPVKDADKDGVEDAEDACPTEAGTVALKGCPVRDADKDGVEDALDNCPRVAGPAENQGCPAEKKQQVTITREQIQIKDKVYFQTGKAVLLTKSFALLEQVAAVMNEHPEIAKIRVEGHTDNTGAAAFNLTLSQARADSVVAYLVKKGVAAGRLEAKGVGDQQPAGPNDTAAGREANRRVEFHVVKAAGAQ